MNDAHVASWRAPIFLIALIAATALPAAAQPPQPRTPQEVDQAVTKQQESIERLNRELADIKNGRDAPVVAWVTLGIVGVFSVLVWGRITLTREQARVQETHVETQQKITEAISKQVELIDSAANARVKVLTELLREARTPPASPAAAKEKNAFLEFIETIADSWKSGR